LFSDNLMKAISSYLMMNLYL